jgi:putative endonuclease
MEGYVYILKSKKRNWHYVGSTTNLRERIIMHNSGRVKSTKFDHPLILIYYEAYPDYRMAKKREYELKNNNQQKEFIYKRLGIK